MAKKEILLEKRVRRVNMRIIIFNEQRTWLIKNDW